MGDAENERRAKHRKTEKEWEGGGGGGGRVLGGISRGETERKVYCEVQRRLHLALGPIYRRALSFTRAHCRSRTVFLTVAACIYLYIRSGYIVRFSFSLSSSPPLFLPSELPSRRKPWSEMYGYASAERSIAYGSRPRNNCLRCRSADVIRLRMYFAEETLLQHNERRLR